MIAWKSLFNTDMIRASEVNCTAIPLLLAIQMLAVNLLVLEIITDGELFTRASFGCLLALAC